MATTTPIYGFDVPTSTDYVKDGATAIETLGDDVDAMLGTAFNSKLHPGLVLLTSQTIGTGVSTVSVSNVFNSTYTHYRVIYSPLAGSTTGTTTYIRFRTGSTDNSNSNYAWAGNQVTYAGTGSVGYGSGASLGFIGFGAYTTGNAWGSHVMDIFNPQLAQYTLWESQGTGVNTGGVLTRSTFGGYFNANTSFDGITFIPTAGTLTGGTIAVYGYAKD